MFVAQGVSGAGVNIFGEFGTGSEMFRRDAQGYADQEVIHDMKVEAC